MWCNLMIKSFSKTVLKFMTHSPTLYGLYTKRHLRRMCTIAFVNHINVYYLETMMSYLLWRCCGCLLMKRVMLMELETPQCCLPGLDSGGTCGSTQQTIPSHLFVINS